MGLLDHGGAAGEQQRKVIQQAGYKIGLPHIVGAGGVAPVPTGAIGPGDQFWAATVGSPSAALLVAIVRAHSLSRRTTESMFPPHDVAIYDAVRSESQLKWLVPRWLTQQAFHRGFRC